MSENNDSQWDEEIDRSANVAEHYGDEEASRGKQGSVLDLEEKYYPFFLLAEPLEERQYFDKMYEHSEPLDSPLMYVTTNATTDVIQIIEANLAACPPGGKLRKPFLNSTVEQVYEYFKNHLRPADDDPHAWVHTFTYFTFVVIDADCVKSEPWQCIVCCDVPDFGENERETHLKQLRLPIARAMEALPLLETLVQTPSEVVNEPELVLGMMPPGWDVEIHDDQGNRTGDRMTAPPGRARAKKAYNIWKWEHGLR
ncbi:hypothetical protein ACLMJK_001483 [Lecanora helva]